MVKQKSTSEILKKRAKRDKRSFIINILLWFARLVVLIISSITIAIGGIYFYLSRDLPKISSLTDYRPPIITTVYSDDNRKIAEFYKERRIILPLSEMPEMLLEAFIAAEDARFFTHKGIDFLSIIRAYSKNIEAGTIVQGGSTITQQVTENLYR